MVGPAITALGCWSSSGELVFLGLAFCGAAQAIVLLSRAAAAEMFPPERRARGMSYVLFGAVSGAIFGPLVFGPIFAGRDAHARRSSRCRGSARRSSRSPGFLDLVPRPPRPEGALEGVRDRAEESAPPAPLGEILRRPGVPTAMLAAVASFAVMVGVMNLAGYVAVGHGHEHGDVFTIISAHIVGMYGLVLVAGDLVDRIGRDALDGDRADADGRLERRRSSGSTASPACRSRSSGSGSAGTSPTSPRRRSSSRSPRRPSAAG